MIITITYRIITKFQNLDNWLFSESIFEMNYKKTITLQHIGHPAEFALLPPSK